MADTMCCFIWPLNTHPSLADTDASAPFYNFYGCSRTAGDFFGVSPSAKVGHIEVETMVALRTIGMLPVLVSAAHPQEGQSFETKPMGKDANHCETSLMGLFNANGISRVYKFYMGCRLNTLLLQGE